MGSINLDISVRGETIPSAGETVLGEAALLSPGGKGANQALAAGRFGAATRLIGAVGNDQFANAALACLRNSPVNLDGVQTLEGESTGLAMIHVNAEGDNAILVAPGANASVRADMVSDATLRSCAWLLMQLETPVAEVISLARRAKVAQCYVVLNAAPMPPTLTMPWPEIDLLIVNNSEAAELANQLYIGGRTPDALALALARKLGPDVLLTCGDQGAVYACANGKLTTQPALAVQALDTTGAGDTFVGVFCAARAQGADIKQALRHASVAAAISCERLGAQAAQPTRVDILARQLPAGSRVLQEQL
jgi:ribokinase